MSKFSFCLLFFSLFSIAYAGTKGFCFSRATDLARVKSKVYPFLSGSDEVIFRKQSHCIEVTSAGQREELISSVILENFAVKDTYGLKKTKIEDVITVNKNVKPCRFLLITQKSRKGRIREAELSDRSKLGETQTKGMSSSQSFMTLMPGLPSMMKINDEDISVVCKKVGRGYEVALSLWGKDNGMVTTVNVQKGQRTEIGGVVQNLKDQDKTISTNKLRNRKSHSERVTKYYLTIQ